MTEAEAQDWLRARGWLDGVAGDRLRAFVGLVLEEADRQNLISASSREHIWARHIVDSAQLLTLVPNDHEPSGAWLDLGTGAGFPGMVIGCLSARPVRLIEVRPLRVAFLERCVRQLGMDHVEVVGAKVENAQFSAPAGVISARAYAPLDRLLASAHHLADQETRWLLPKGRNSEKELEIVRRDWQAVFHVEQSITDPESAIVTIDSLQKMHAQQPSSRSRGQHGRERFSRTGHSSRSRRPKS